MADIKISRVEFLYYSRKDKRMIKVTFTDREVAYISPCHEGWEIWHCTVPYKQVAMPIADKYNGYLHGADLVREEYE